MHRTLRRLGIIVVMLATTPASAQLPGTLVNGTYGLRAGSQPPEGLILTPFVFDWYTTELVDQKGKKLNTTGTSNMLGAPALDIAYVSPFKILGANYGASVTLWAVAGRLDAPRFDLSTSGYGFGDMGVKPVELGWHTAYADFIAAFELWIPTGRYTALADDNSGLGQWGYEFSAGSTVFFDDGRHLNFATRAFYDIYSPKTSSLPGPRGTTMQTGNTLTLMGGLGYALLGGGLNFGIPYFLQWKVTQDKLPPSVLPAAILNSIGSAKSFAVGLGAEVDLFWAPTDGVVLRWVQAFEGWNTGLGPIFLLAYTHRFELGKAPAGRPG